MGRKKIQISRINDERNRQNLQRKEHKIGGGLTQNHCQSPDSDDDSQDGMSPGPAMTNGHQSYSSQQSLSNMTTPDDVTISAGVAGQAYNNNAGGSQSNSDGGRMQSLALTQRNQPFPNFLPIPSAAAAATYMLGSQMLYNATNNGPSLKNTEANVSSLPNSYGIGSNTRDESNNAVRHSSSQHLRSPTNHHPHGGSRSWNNASGDNNGNLRVSIPNGNVISADHVRMPLNSPAAGSGAGYQASLPSGFMSSDFHLSSADISMLRNLETAGLLSSWSAGQNGLALHNNSHGLQSSSDANLVNKGAVDSHNHHHSNFLTVTNNRNMVKSEPSSPQRRSDDGGGGGGAAGGSGLTRPNVLVNGYSSDVNGRSSSTYDDRNGVGDAQAAKRQRTDPYVRPASVTVWSQA